MICSFFGGSCLSTSFFSRRSRWGFSMSCSLEIWSSFPMFANSSWNSSRSLNSPWSRKCMSMKSSSRLFCSGVPVSRTRWNASRGCRALKSFDSLFFSRWPSSTTTQAQVNFCIVEDSARTFSYVVSRMLNLGRVVCGLLPTLRPSS